MDNFCKASKSDLKIGVDSDLTEADRVTWVDCKQKECGSLIRGFEENEVFLFWCKTGNIQRCYIQLGLHWTEK